MAFFSAGRADSGLPSGLGARSGEAVPYVDRVRFRPAVLSPAARRGIRQRMLLLRQASLERVSELTGASLAEIAQFRRDLKESSLPDTLLDRGAGLAYARELPQGALLYLLVRAARPSRVIETGVGPGYSTAWILAALDANHEGELVSLGPGPVAGRAIGVREFMVGQFVPPSLRTRWTLALGNSEDRLRAILAGTSRVDLFFYDNGPVASRARFELRAAWEALSPRGILLAHHTEANSAWNDFCRNQGSVLQLLDPGPPPMGALAVRSPT